MRQCAGNHTHYIISLIILSSRGCVKKQCAQSLEFVPDRFKTGEMCNEAVEVHPCTLWHEDPYILKLIPDHVKTKKMYNEEMCNNLAAFFFIPNHFKTQEM